MTHPCPTPGCGGQMRVEPASTDDHPDGRTLATTGASWYCPVCAHDEPIEQGDDE